MRRCIYCGLRKAEEEFSDEHIWPEALGGDFLPPFWRTDDVCRVCNNRSGLFVDGAFIKSFFVSGERAYDGLEYLDPDKPTGMLPLNYLGTIQDIVSKEGEVADFWVCAPGANIVHFRNADERGNWAAYAGGDPRRAKAGRIVFGLTSTHPYWLCTAISSVKRHFPKAEKFVTNLELPPTAKHFKEINVQIPQQLADLEYFKEIEASSVQGRKLHMRVAIDAGADTRFLAKLALATGYKLFGPQFLQTPYGLDLRRAFQETSLEKRLKIPIRGSGYLRSINLNGLEEKLRWPGGWVLFLLRHRNSLSLTVQPPSGRGMVIKITDDRQMLELLGPEYSVSKAWLTIPAAARSVGPISFPEYLAHQMGQSVHPELLGLEGLRGRKDRLPPTGIFEPIGRELAAGGP